MFPKKSINPYEGTAALHHKKDYSNRQGRKKNQTRKLRKRVGYSFFRKRQHFSCVTKPPKNQLKLTLP